MSAATPTTPWRTGHPDWLLVFLASALTLTGLVMVYTSSFVIGLAQFGDEHHFIIRQAIWACGGAVALIVLARMDYRILRTFAMPIMGLTLVALVAVLVVGDTVNGAKRWIGTGPFAIQPAEFAKLTTIIYLAAWLEARGAAVKSFEQGLLPFLVIIGSVAALIMAEPSLGTTFIILVITVVMFWVAGATIGQMLLIGVGGITTLIFLATVEGYRMERLTAFLNADEDTAGANFQTTQSLMAIGNGGWDGLGLGASRAKFFYIPESHTDGVFAILGEELGLVAGLAVLLLFTAFMLRGYRAGQRAPDRFGLLLATGISTWVIAQAILNIGGITRMFPLTGVPLPFLSYGGSALASVMCGVGVLISVSRAGHGRNAPSRGGRIVHRRRSP